MLAPARAAKDTVWANEVGVPVEPCTIGSSGNGVHRETQKRRENKAWLQMSTTRNIVQTLVGVGR